MLYKTKVKVWCCGREVFACCCVVFFEEGLVQMGAILFYVCVFFYVGVSC